MTIECVLIGGPRDHVVVPMPAYVADNGELCPEFQLFKVPTVYGSANYTLRRIATPYGELHMYVHENMDDHMAIKKLIRHYGKTPA